MRAVHRGDLQRVRDVMSAENLANTAGFEHGRGPGMGNAYHAPCRIGPDLSRRSLPLQKFARQLDSIDDLLVAGAAAEVPARAFLISSTAGVGFIVQQGLGGHDHARAYSNRTGWRR